MQQQIIGKKGKSPNRIAKEKFHGRRMSLIKKAYQIGEMCEAAVYIVLYRNHRYYTYSNKKASWPPSEKEIVSYFTFLLKPF